MDHWRRTLPPDQFEAFRKQKQQARESLCEACKRMPSQDVPRVTRAEISGDWETALSRISSGEAFVVVDALEGDRRCKALLDVDPIHTPAYWMNYVGRVKALAQARGTDSLGDSPDVFTAAFNSFDHCFAKGMHSRWSSHDLAWCSARMTGTAACGSGELAFPSDVKPKLPPGASEAAVRAALGSIHQQDFYVGWSTWDEDIKGLLSHEAALRACLPIIGDARLSIGATQWWRVGRSVHAPVVGEPEHIDMIGMASECHLQVSGRKGWRLRPPVPCAKAGGPCTDGREQFVVVSAGQMLCLSIDRLRHATVLVPEELEEASSRSGALNVDIAYDIRLRDDADEPGAARPLGNQYAPGKMEL